MDLFNSTGVAEARRIFVEDQLTSITFNLEKKVSSPMFFICRESMKDFFDVTITCNKNEIKAHRMVLAAQSSFFKKRLSNDLTKPNNNNNSHFAINLDVLDWNSVVAVIDCMYSSQITITNENVYSLIKTSEHFDMPEIKKFCLDFLQAYLQTENCIKIMEFAQSQCLDELKATAQNYLIENFHYVYLNEEFKSLEFHKLVEIIRIIRNSSFKICESEIFSSIVYWVKADHKRNVHFTELFEFIQLNKLKLTYLTTRIANEELVSSSLPCMKILVAAIQSSVESTKWTKGLSDNDFVQITITLVRQREFFVQYFRDDVSCWYVISSEWLDRWLKFVTNNGYDWSSHMKVPDPPGPIDNSSLFTSESCKMLKRNLLPMTDYKFIPERAWHMLCDCYGTVEGQAPVTEKGPVFKNEERIDQSFSNDSFLIDGICLRVQKTFSQKSTYTGSFSRWDRVEAIEKEARRVFEVSKTQTVSLHHRFDKLDPEKLVADYDFKPNDVLILTIEDSNEVKINFSEIAKQPTNFMFPVNLKQIVGSETDKTNRLLRKASQRIKSQSET